MRLDLSRCFTLLCALLAASSIAAGAHAQARQSRLNTPGGIAEGRLMKQHASELGLSEEVIAKIDASIEADTAEEKKLRELSVAALEDLNKVLAQKMPSEKDLMAASDKVGEIASKSRELKMKSVIRVRSLLTPEQLDKFIELRAQVTERR
jgi:Spy/CpxP family protein refolding chaperone